MVLFGTEIDPFRLPDMASSSSAILLSQEEIHLFHSIDRQLYTLLVTDLCRDPLESMQAMSLWIWLERAGFNHIIRKILSLPHTFIGALADEALTCLNIITAHNNYSTNNNFNLFPDGTSGSEIPLTQKIIKREISLQFFHENKAIAIRGIAKVGTEVCIRALSDIMVKALELKKSVRNQAVRRHKMPDTDDSFVNGFMRLGLGDEIFGGGVGRSVVVPTDERTMFVTFSKGYPVAEHEVRGFFTKTFGDCIESFYMQEVKPPEEQALFARIVFYNPYIIDLILDGVAKAKFNINGKHVWMRKFVISKGQESPSPPRNQTRAN